jgi:hypothetical protein
MRTTHKFPHLTQVAELWKIVDLELWTPRSNVYIPIKRPDPLALDHKIQVKLGPVLDVLRAGLDKCIETPRAAVLIRTPYTNSRDNFNVIVNRALLSMMFDFSYHNWVENARGTTLGRTCENVVCRNPFHYVMGTKPSHNPVIPSLHVNDKPIEEEPDPTLPPAVLEWLAVTGEVGNLAAECAMAGDS